MPRSLLVLLALEDAQIVQLFKRALGAAAFRAAIAQDRIALEKALQESRPALVIIDENFSGLNQGFTVSAALLERFPTLPIILYCRQETPTILKTALRVGIYDCLFPPLHVEEIAQVVDNCLKRAKHTGDWTRRELRRTTASLQQRIDELKKLETIIEQIDNGVMILDEKLNILLINSAARRIFGIWKEEDIQDKPVMEVIPHPDLRSLSNIKTTNHLTHQEIVFDDGRVLTAQYSPIPGIGVVITMQDITYIKQLDRLKSEFVNAVSHDLRSPLTSILGYIELFDRVGPVNQQQLEFIERIRISVHDITELVNDLLELGRIEAGYDSQKETISLPGIIRYTLENLNPQVIERKQKIDFELTGEIPPIRGNPIRLRQMMENLIGNAIKYTPVKGEINIWIEIQEDQIILYVKDTGPGIPPADQPHIFEKFYRASNVPKGVGGSGLGLAIVKSIVDNHHGRIWVDSVLGQGSTFAILLPIYKSEKIPTRLK